MKKKLSKKFYLFLDFLIFIFPIINSFFYNRFTYPIFFPGFLSIFLTSLLFIIQDQIVTNHWWYFNNKYITGLKIGKLPIEEILFFPIVSFSCLIIWVNLIKINLPIYININSFFLLIFLFIFLIIGLIFLFIKKHYTGFVFLTQGITFILDFILKTNLYQLLYSYIFLTICVFLTLIFNYFLTSKKVVIYPKKYKTEIRFLTIPIEDFIYGLNFLTLTIITYQFFLNRIPY